MSLIVAIKKDGVVYLGADTRCTKGTRVRSNLHKEELKIQKLNDCYIGAAGNLSNLQVMLSHPEWFDLKGKELTKKFLVCNVIPNYYMLMKEEMRKGDEQNEDKPDSECSFIVTDGKKIFEITSGYEVIEISRFSAIGCTRNIALTVMLTSNDSEPNDIILKSLRNSSWRNNFVAAPYVLVNTKDNKFEMVEE